MNSVATSVQKKKAKPNREADIFTRCIRAKFKHWRPRCTTFTVIRYVGSAPEATITHVNVYTVHISPFLKYFLTTSLPRSHAAQFYAALTGAHKVVETTFGPFGVWRTHRHGQSSFFQPASEALHMPQQSQTRSENEDWCSLRNTQERSSKWILLPLLLLRFPWAVSCSWDFHYFWKVKRSRLIHLCIAGELSAWMWETVSVLSAAEN